ncbi:hypothetical protein V1477_017686 [Vespula maculifrons]|uniref:Uncharacterized protein n=1 Tax=Vespula maculifrons TaxID=7453 RepID=A0ABD2B6S2_VESMC
MEILTADYASGKRRTRKVRATSVEARKTILLDDGQKVCSARRSNYGDGLDEKGSSLPSELSMFYEDSVEYFRRTHGRKGVQTARCSEKLDSGWLESKRGNERKRTEGERSGLTALIEIRLLKARRRKEFACLACTDENRVCQDGVLDSRTKEYLWKL